MVRSAPDASRGDIQWDPEGVIDAQALNDLHAVVHLAGEPIGRRWIGKRKQRIRDSRVDGTALLARTLAGLARPPQVLVSASAVGFYGDRDDEVLTEASPPGFGFFPETAVLWEAAAKQAEAAGTRVSILRQGWCSPDGRRAREDAARLQGGCGCTAGERESVAELDLAGRSRTGDPARIVDPPLPASSTPLRPTRYGMQNSPNPRQSAATPHAAACSSRGDGGALRRDGRHYAAGEPARYSRAPARPGLLLRAPRCRGCSQSGSGPMSPQCRVVGATPSPAARS